MAGVECKLIAVIVLGFLTNDVECVGTQRLCGKELADALALLCQGRGYNVAFKPQGEKTMRYKRGIVDECCKRGCTLKTLESYCSDEMPTKRDTLQISKRSELSSSEIRTKIRLGRRSEERRLFDSSVKFRNRKLQSLGLLRHDKSGSELDDRISDLTVKSDDTRQKPEDERRLEIKY